MIVCWASVTYFQSHLRQFAEILAEEILRYSSKSPSLSFRQLFLSLFKKRIKFNPKFNKKKQQQIWARDDGFRTAKMFLGFGLHKICHSFSVLYIQYKLSLCHQVYCNCKTIILFKQVSQSHINSNNHSLQLRYVEYYLWTHTCWTLKQMGYSSRRPHRVPLLSAKNRKRRLQFAQCSSKMEQ